MNELKLKAIIERLIELEIMNAGGDEYSQGQSQAYSLIRHILTSYLEDAALSYCLREAI